MRLTWRGRLVLWAIGGHIFALGLIVTWTLTLHRPPNRQAEPTAPVPQQRLPEPPAEPPVRTSAVPLLVLSRVEAWRRLVARASLESDKHWAARIAAELACSYRSQTFRRVTQALTDRLQQRTQLDRSHARFACSLVCDAGSNVGSESTATCVPAMCVCNAKDGEDVDAAEVSLELAAARVVVGAPNGSALRAARRFESVLAKARTELAAGIEARVLAFARHSTEACAPASFDDAYEASVTLAPDGGAAPALRFAELRIAARPAYQQCARRDAGDTWLLRTRAAGDEVSLQVPLLRELGRGQYVGSLLLAEQPAGLELFWTNTRFAGWFDLHAAAAAGPPVPCPLGHSLTQAGWRDRIASHTIDLSLAGVPIGGDTVQQEEPARACATGEFSGRWIGAEWAAHACFLRPYSAGLLQRCAASRPLRLRLFGDSIMRGLFFDLSELLMRTQLDRAWAKRHAGPCNRRGAARGACDGSRRLEYARGDVHVSWRWWTLHDTAAGGPNEWSLDDADAVVLFGSAAHEMKHGSIGAYAAGLSRLVEQLRALRAARRLRAQLHWLVAPASHILDDDVQCRDDNATTHLLSHHRSMVFAAVGAELMRAAVPLLDAWRLTSGQADRCVNLHYDALYVNESAGAGEAADAPREAWRQGGPISRELANLFLNVACNRRVLRPDELRWEL